MIKAQISLFYFLFLLISLFCTCSDLSDQESVSPQENENPNIEVETSESAQLHNEMIKQHPDPFYFVDTVFTRDPFEFGEISVANILKSYPEATVESETEENRYSPNVIDTIININVNGAEFAFHRTFDKELFLGALIENNAVSFRNGIKIGMSKGEFISKFDFPDQFEGIPSTFQIGAYERTIYVEFEFDEEDILTRIYYVNYVD